MVKGTRLEGAPLRGLHRRRPRHHGGRQPRRRRRARNERRPDDLDSDRGIRQPLRDARARVPLSLLLHAQVLVHLPGEGGDRVSGRLRHPRRAVRAADAGADAQDDQADADRAVRHALLARGDQFRRPGRARHDRRQGRRAGAPHRLGRRRLRLDRRPAERGRHGPAGGDALWRAAPDAIRPARSDPRSSPWSTPPRSPARTSPSRPRSHRPRPAPAAASSSRRRDRRASRST